VALSKCRGRWFAEWQRAAAVLFPAARGFALLLTLAPLAEAARVPAQAAGENERKPQGRR
jgi:hypothetical protein